MNERKDAITKRPIDFEKEEETRKDETMKWLESHFGSESRSSRDSQDDDDSKKKSSFFNVTIKSNAKTSPPPIDPGYAKSPYTSNLKSPSKVVLPEREAPKQPKYFQGISDWSERKESAPRNFSTKTFQDELKGTLERNKLRHVTSREELRPNRYKEDVVKSDDEARKKNIKNEIRYGSRGDLRYRRDSRGGSDDSRNLKTQREDLGYMSGSRTDVRPRDDLYAKSRKTTNYLHREDSGYVKDSREDIRYGRTIPTREDSFIRDSGEDEKHYKDTGKYVNSAIQRDDSAYVSSSTYFTEPRTPKNIPLRTPDSGIRSPSPEAYDSETLRPSVPQRKRMLEKKMRSVQKDLDKDDEPPPDYSPPSRSRSISPMPSPNLHANGGHKKMYQKTRFASSSELSRPMSTQTTETQTSPPKKKGLSIGNSIRKLVGKIRSASADRKSKQKAKQSSSPQNKHQQQPQQQPYDTNDGSTYQQYNVIDSHIGQQPQQQSTKHHTPLSNRESSVVSSGRRERTLDRRGSSDVDSMAIPKQKYYLGEDPYLSIYGKENKYDGTKPSQHQQRYPGRRQRSEDVEIYNPPRYVHYSYKDFSKKSFFS